jgi:hypothetical protein
VLTGTGICACASVVPAQGNQAIRKIAGGEVTTIVGPTRVLLTKPSVTAFERAVDGQGCVCGYRRCRTRSFPPPTSTGRSVCLPAVVMQWSSLIWCAGRSFVAAAQRGRRSHQRHGSRRVSRDAVRLLDTRTGEVTLLLARGVGVDASTFSSSAQFCGAAVDGVYGLRKTLLFCQQSAHSVVRLSDPTFAVQSTWPTATAWDNMD